MAKTTTKSKPTAKPARPAKPAARAAKPKPKAKPRAAAVDRGESSYAVQARKMRALLDILLEAGEPLAESAVQSAMQDAGFPLHARTLAREVERLKVLGYGVERTLGEAGVQYALVPDPKVNEAFATLEAVRKELRKSGLGVLEKQVAAALKGLKG